MKRLFIYWVTLRQCFHSMKWSKLNLGDWVTFEGKTWELTQGVANPYWNLSRSWVALPPSEKGRRENVHRDSFQKIRCWRNLFHDFKSTWRFYSGYWHAIWLRKTRAEILASNIIGFQR